MTQLAATFAALSDRTRLAVVERLMAQGELAAGDLVAHVEMTAPAVSRHLKVLRKAGVIQQRVAGTKRYYSVQPDALKAISDWTISHRAFWEAGLDRLDALLAQDGGTEDG
ncbi:helix-turn-helix transcriptional regulator [Sulfitobacter sp. SK011]|uniref:ArsR/SmtB family transcription factor n=1 Tax=Sulfitobacter sp. SK011 TaxID=1389004 RepID=UPI000E0BAB8B|nr:metalloregulator ArsR/SmtB family transcription factor [Sulfitobacter sp. SK011]AXI44050.1 transcriptional regulator [Sulfitobacter sp. SK011]